LNFTLYDIADRLSGRGWQVPAYPMPANRQDLIVQRVVVKHGFTHDMADMLLKDIRSALDYFAHQPGHTRTEKGRQRFAH
jgi:glutamate decarboxylase